MRTNRRADSAKNELVNRFGSARFYEVPRGRKEWSDPKVPEYKPNWVVRFHVGGKTWTESAGPMYPVLDGLEAVKLWAETRMETELKALRAGKLEEMQQVVRKARVVMLAELGQVYLSNVPPNKFDYRRNWYRLESIMTEATGLEPESIEVTDKLWTRGLLLGWVRMRQEHFRRGWTGRDSAAPADAWAQLRAELRAGKLPGVDKSAVLQCNTTIKTYVRCAKAVFANQREYLVGLQLPVLKEFLGFTVDLEAPEGHREISADALEALRGDEARLAREEPKVWAFHLLASWTGARPVTIRQLTGSALTVHEDGSGEVALPSAKGGKAVRVAIDAEAVSAIQAVMTAESLIGARHKTEGDLLHRAHNAWLSKHGVEGTLKSYQFRHRRLQQYREVGGLEMAAAGGGHTTTAMVEKRYTQGAKVIPMVDPRTGQKVG